MSDPLAELQRMTFDPANCEQGMCFVPADLYERASIAMTDYLKSAKRLNYSESGLVQAGIPNFLACGCWIVPDTRRQDALLTVAGTGV